MKETPNHFHSIITIHKHVQAELVAILSEFYHNSSPFPFAFEEAAHVFLQTLLFQRLMSDLAPCHFQKDNQTQIIKQAQPPAYLQKILVPAAMALMQYQVSGEKNPYKDVVIDLLDLPLLAAFTPQQASQGAYFTPPDLARQISQEVIANWVLNHAPEELRKMFKSPEQQVRENGGYISGPAVDEFYAIFPRMCAKFLKKGKRSKALLHRLFDQVLNCQVFDPTCGAGIFLLTAGEVLELLATTLRDVLGDLTPDATISCQIYLQNLFGLDLTPQFIWVARNSIFLRVLSSIPEGQVLENHRKLMQRIQLGNAILSPFRGILLPDIPAFLGTNILLEICTCFLDVIGNNARKQNFRVTELVALARGPIEAIMDSAWHEFAMYLGLPQASCCKDDLVFNVLETLVPKMKGEIKSYDVILGNPPHEGARKETGRQSIYSWVTRVQRQCVKYLQQLGYFNELQHAWDFSLPFASQALEMLREGDNFAMILPRALGTQSFGRKFLTKHAKRIRHITYFSSRKGVLFHEWNGNSNTVTGVGNDFLVLSACGSELSEVLFAVEELTGQSYNTRPINREIRSQDTFSAFFTSPPHATSLPGIPLRFIATVTKGATLCARAEWRHTRGVFKIRDLVVSMRDSNHPIRLIEPSHIAPFEVIGESFLEYKHEDYPDRVPANIHRWRGDSFFQGPVLATPLSKNLPHFAIIPPDFDPIGWRAPETVILIKRWADWFQETPGHLSGAVARMERRAISKLILELGENDCDPLQGQNLLRFVSQCYPLELLVMVLSSSIVHAYRLKNAKSFGKFEAGDWEQLNIPIFTTSEVSKLLENYQRIHTILKDIADLAITKTRDDLDVKTRGKAQRALVIGLAKAFFEGKNSLLHQMIPDLIFTDLTNAETLFVEVSQIVENAYQRSRKTNALQDLLKSAQDTKQMNPFTE